MLRRVLVSTSNTMGITPALALCCALLFLLLAHPAQATISNLTLTTPAVTSPQPAGATIPLQASCSYDGGGDVEYMFRATAGSTTTFQTAYATTTQVNWTPSQTGVYTLRVDAREVGTTVPTYSTTLPFVITSIVSVTLTTPGFPSPQPPGEITLQAGVSYQGNGTLEYRFCSALSGVVGETIIQDFSTATSCNWNATATGRYKLFVYVREQGCASLYEAVAQINYYYVTSIDALSLSATPAKPKPVGTELTLTANASYSGNGTLEYEYQYRVDNSYYPISNGFITNASCPWTTPSPTGNYMVYVFVREVGCPSSYERAISIYYMVSPLTGLTITTPNSAFPQPTGNSILLRATPTLSEPATIEYQFKTKIGGVSQTIRDFATDAEYVWIPETPGSYLIEVYARQVDGFSPYELSASTPACTIIAATPPSVSVTSPATGATILTTEFPTLITATASDDVSISQVEFYCDGALMGAGDTTAPYTFTWNSAAPGSYTLTARAYDNYGSSTLSAPVSVLVNTLPEVTLLEPLDGTVYWPYTDIVLQASASDPDIDDSIDRVEFYQGDILLGIGTPMYGDYYFYWEGGAPGSYVFTAKAYDARTGVTTSTPVTIRVNASPIITEILPASGSIFTSPADVLLQVVCNDPDGTVSRVEFYDADNYTFLGVDEYMPFTFNWQGLTSGTYTVYVCTYDNDGATEWGSTSFTVNEPPVVYLMSPWDGEVIHSDYLPYYLYAEAYDIDDGVTKVEFYANDELLGEVIAALYNYYEWLWNPAPGAYTLTAKAYDGYGAISTSTPVNVRINQSPVLTEILPASGTVFTAPADVLLQVIGSDADGTVSRVEFYDGDTYAFLGSDETAPFSFNWQALPGGTYSVYVQLYDNDGGAAWGTTSFIVNEPPTISLMSPVDGEVIHSNFLPYYLYAVASDVDDGIDRVEFYANGVLLGQKTMPMYGYYDCAWNPTPGAYLLTAKAYDTRGAETTTASIMVRVNQAPVITGTQPAFGTVFAEPADVLIEVTGTDADGTVARVEFYDAATYELLHTATAAPFTFSWDGLPAGSYTVMVQLYDNDGAWETSYVTFIVNDLPTISIIDPLEGMVIHSDFLPYSLWAESHDMDGVARVEFYANDTLLGEVTTSPDYYTWAWDPAPGMYTLTTKAYDTRGAYTISEPVTVRINAVPQITSILPTGGSTFTGPANVQLEVTGTDPDGTVAYVEFYNGNTFELLYTDTEAPYTYLWENLPGDTYWVYVRLYDNDGAGVTGATYFTVEGTTNVAPTVSITAPAHNTHFTAPVPITLTALASDETFGDYVTVDFYRGSTRIGRAEQVNDEFVLVWEDAVPGTYTLTARACDRWGLVTVSALVTIVVHQNTSPTVALVSPLDGAILPGPATLQLKATAFDTDYGDGISLVEFYSETDLLGNGELVDGEYLLTWANVPAGMYTLSAIAYDNRGEMATSESVTITVNPNTLPVVRFTSPPNGASFTEPATVLLSVVANDADEDDSIITVEFYQGTTLLGEGNLVDGEYQYSWDDVPAGAYTITAKAYDNHGEVGLATINIPISQDGETTAFVHDGWDAVVSGGGRYIAFVSDASTIVEDDINEVADIFLTDRQTGVTQRINLGINQAEADDASWGVAMSRNGRYIAFVSAATNLVANDTNGQPDVFCYDQQTGTLVRINVHSNGTQANGICWDIALSADGRYVAFTSDATNLVVGDTNGQADIFLRDRLSSA